MRRKRNPVVDTSLPGRDVELAEVLKADFRKHGAMAVAAAREKNPAT